METSVARQPVEQLGNGVDRYLRMYNDTATWSAEALYGSMRSSFEYRYDGAELRAEDGGAMGEVFDDAIRTAHTIVERNPQLLFELRRRLIEREEYAEMLAMARGELANTMIVVSDFPPELGGATQDIGGYNSQRKQTMLRVITRQPNGTIRMVSQSLDGSNRVALEAVYPKLGQAPQAGELLGQRIHLEQSSDEQAELVDTLTNIYDVSMRAQFGGYWHAGIRQPGNPINTYEFAREQHDLLDWFSGEKMKDSVGAERLRFKLAAAMSARFERAWSGGINQQTHFAALTNYERAQFDAEIELASTQAAREGRVFSGCGSSIAAEQSLLESELDQAGYGNKTSETSKYSFDKRMHCVVCQSPPKAGESKKMCGPCGICKGCDHKLGGKG